MSTKTTAQSKAEERLLRDREAALILNTSVAQLAKLRWERRGPAWVKLGRSVRYRRSDLDRYIEAGVQRTS